MSVASQYKIRISSFKSVIVIKGDFSYSFIVFSASYDNILVPHVYPTALAKDKNIITFYGNMGGINDKFRAIYNCIKEEVIEGIGHDKEILNENV